MRVVVGLQPTRVPYHRAVRQRGRLLPPGVDRVDRFREKLAGPHACLCWPTGQTGRRGHGMLNPVAQNTAQVRHRRFGHVPGLSTPTGGVGGRGLMRRTSPAFGARGWSRTTMWHGVDPALGAVPRRGYQA